jgi:hypothetical protein
MRHRIRSEFEKLDINQEHNGGNSSESYHAEVNDYHQRNNVNPFSPEARVDHENAEIAHDRSSGDCL